MFFYKKCWHLRNGICVGDRRVTSQRKTPRNCEKRPLSSKLPASFGWPEYRNIRRAQGITEGTRPSSGTGRPTSGLGLAAALQHKADVVCAKDLLLEVAHEVSQAGEAAVRTVQTVATLLHLDLKVLELFLATQHLPFRKLTRNDLL